MSIDSWVDGQSPAANMRAICLAPSTQRQLRRKIRDSYSAQVWLEGRAVSFLESLYPNDELSVQIARYINDGMTRTRKHQANSSPHKAPSVQVLRAVPDVAESSSSLHAATAKRILDLEQQNDDWEHQHRGSCDENR